MADAEGHVTLAKAARITSATEAVSVARNLAFDFAAGAADRDRHRELPYREVERLGSSGLLAITVPASEGGADLPPSIVAEVIRILATADPNIAQIPHSHFVYLNLLRLAGSPGQRRHFGGQVLSGGRIANAQTERGGATIADVATTLRPTDGHFRIDGAKYYCTGSLFADVFAVLTRLDDPANESDLPEGDYIAYVAADTPGVHVFDDWDGLGQRTTGSGSVKFDGVVAERDQLVARGPAVNAATGYGAFAQLLHAAIDSGIARGAMEAATGFVREKSRPWFEADVVRAIDDPLLIQRFGELAVSVAAAEATLAAAGVAVDATITGGQSQDPDESSANASLAVATAKILADKAANEVASALFEVSGTRSVAADLKLDHYWRNARTHTLHDPVRWKYQHVGRAQLHGTPPPLHGVI